MTKPHFRIRSDGWIVHEEGKPCPVQWDTPVAIEVGYPDREPRVIHGIAGHWIWAGAASDPCRITAYRLA